MYIHSHATIRRNFDFFARLADLVKVFILKLVIQITPSGAWAIAQKVEIVQPKSSKIVKCLKKFEKKKKIICLGGWGSNLGHRYRTLWLKGGDDQFTT